MGNCWICKRDNGRDHPRDASLCSLCIDRWCREVQEVAGGAKA